MKSFFVFLLSITIAFSAYSQSIVSIAVHPANPTTNDTVLVIVNTLFPSGDCPLDYKSHTQTEYTIQAITHHCIGMLAVMCGAVDTFKIDPLAAGVYKFDLTLTSGGLPIPCTPGIVINDQDSIFFTVISTTAIEEVSLSDLSFENPAQDILRFSTALPNTTYIFSITGQLLKVVEKGETEVSIAELYPGVYFLRMNGATRKLVIH